MCKYPQNPTNYTRHGDVVKFHYPFTQLRNFVTAGNETGDVGNILTQIEYVKDKSPQLTFRGYGTLEHPRRQLISIRMSHWPVFDGQMPDPDDIIKPWTFPEFGKMEFMSFDFGLGADKKIGRPKKKKRK